jgi:hypothetical protein
MANRYFALALTAALAAGCGGGQETTQGSSSGGGTASAGESAPSTPSYPLPLSFTVGRAFTLPPTTSETGVSYAVAPSLPDGLNLDPNNGVISGTPVASSPAVSFTITATNGSGVTKSSLMLEVVDGPLFYPSPVLATVGAPMTPISPSGGAPTQSFTVAPALPAGVSLDPVTGVLSGTPLESSPVTYYQITATGQLAVRTYGLLLSVGGEPGSTATGVFRDSTVIGLGYRSGTHTGITDSEGRFTYEIGQSISFSVGAIPLGTVALAKSLVTPVDLIANGTATAPYVVNVARFLMMLDDDGDPSNGIEISPAVTAAAANWAPIDFTTPDLPADLSSVIALASAADGGSHALPDAAAGQSHLTAAVECAYSGGFVGTLAEDSQHAGSDLISFAFTPDGHAEARVETLPAGTTHTSDGTDGLSASLDGSFVATFDTSPPSKIQGAFSGPDYLIGTYDDGSTSRAFTAARIGGATSAQFRYSGAYLKDSSYPTGFAVLDVDASNNIVGLAYGATDQSLYGDTLDSYGDTYGLLLHVNMEALISGTISGNRVSAMLDGEQYEGVGSPTGTTDLHIAFGDVYDGPYFLTRGCRLN